MNYKSHTPEEISKAFEEGNEIWRLDSGNDGEDDVLIGSYEECLKDVLAYHELKQLPESWELTKVDW